MDARIVVTRRERKTVETAIGSTPGTEVEAEPQARDADDDRIVVVRPQVIDNVGHVLGNMFQRIYHLVERTRENDLVTAADLESSTRRLENFLQLLMDYVSPLSLSLVTCAHRITRADGSWHYVDNLVVIARRVS